MEIEYKGNVPMVQTTDLEGNLVIESRNNTTTFMDDGTLTINGNSNVMCWNSGDITHVNFQEDDFSIMYDVESNILTLTAGDKNIFYDLEQLAKLVLDKGMTIEEVEKIKEETEAEEKDKE